MWKREQCYETIFKQQVNLKSRYQRDHLKEAQIELLLIYALASGSYDNSIRRWGVKTGQQKAKLDGHTHYVYSVCFSPDGNTLASGSGDKSIRLWDIKNKNKYCSDYRFKEIQVKNTRYPFFNIPLQYIQYYGLPRLQFFKVQKSFLQKTVSFQEYYWSNT